MKNLVIVESPTKAKTIGKYLGSDYTVKFSMGHVMDLPKNKLGVDIEQDFSPQYEIVSDKKQIIADLKNSAKEADQIILATDPDREGEAIAANIKEILRDRMDRAKFQRIVFHEITKDAIEKALKNPRDIDLHLVNAQTARRVLDRLVGYQISPVLWQKVRRGLSAGRVQSVALRLIVEREREIEKFQKETYFTIHALLRKQNEKHAVEFTLFSIGEKRVDIQHKLPLYGGDYTVSKTIISDKKSAEEIISDLESKQFVVSDVAQKETHRYPSPPYTTSTLQQDASRRFGYPGKRTMSLAQKLYEEGFITYHRTDSVALSIEAINDIRSFVREKYGSAYIPEQPRFYTSKQKLAQEAHEGIRPTNVRLQMSVVRSQLGQDCAKLYDLIWRRAVASQMTDAIIESTTVIVDAIQNTHDLRSSDGQMVDRSDTAGEKISSESDASDIPLPVTYRFKANGSVLKFDGFLKVNPQALQDTRLPTYVAKENLEKQALRADAHETQPPPRYNDASLIATLEEKGIGRPSTYASIISVLTDRAYVERVERRFVPTSVGIAVNDFLVANFSTIDDIPFTAQMEDELDEIARGEKEWVEMMKEFYKPFEQSLDAVQSAARVKIATEELSEACPQCGANLLIRTGRFGKFISCSRFPACKYTRPYIEETNLICPKCAGKLSEADGKQSNSMQGKIIIKKTRTGRKFYGCSNYPKCDFAAWKLEDIKKLSSA